MPSTTVHLPDKLLNKIDQIVNEIGISRNKFIIQACEEALQNHAGRWPYSDFNSRAAPISAKLFLPGRD